MTKVDIIGPDGEYFKIKIVAPNDAGEVELELELVEKLEREASP
jgi:hypothetical protein